MKLVIIIPCLNEEKTLPDVLHTIPKKIPGISKIETIVIDDGSTDKTIPIAKKHGVNHLIIHRKNKGLARSFADGIEEALRLGADIIVNTDGDNQLPQEDIPRLIKPILDNKADMVIGDRQTQKIKYFQLHKKILQKVGSQVVSFVAGVDLPDAVSGFRAYSRSTAMRLNIFTNYSYTIETLVQIGQRRKRIATIPIKTREAKRKSRLIRSLSSYIKSSASTILRVFAVYQPLKAFFIIGSITAIPGIILVIRFIYIAFFAHLNGTHLQSLLAAAVFILLGFQIFILGVVADLIGINRKINENILFHLKKLEYDEKISSNKVKYVKNNIKRKVNGYEIWSHVNDKKKPVEELKQQQIFR